MDEKEKELLEIIRTSKDPKGTMLYALYVIDVFLEKPLPCQEGGLYSHPEPCENPQ